MNIHYGFDCSDSQMICYQFKYAVYPIQTNKHTVYSSEIVYHCVCLIWFFTSQSTIFQLCRDRFCG